MHYAWGTDKIVNTYNNFLDLAKLNILKFDKMKVSSIITYIIEYPFSFL